MTDPELRLQLEQITQLPDALDWPAKIVQLASRYPHSIRHVGYPVDRGFNCFAYALGLTYSNPYREIASRSKPNIWANFEFVEYLLGNSHLRKCDRACPGDLAIYFANDHPEHAAVVQLSNRFLSKWGSGPVFEHASTEVPANYGEPAYFHATEPSAVEEAFFEYCRTKGTEPKAFDRTAG